MRLVKNEDGTFLVDRDWMEGAAITAARRRLEILEPADALNAEVALSVVIEELCDHGLLLATILDYIDLGDDDKPEAEPAFVTEPVKE